MGVHLIGCKLCFFSLFILSLKNVALIFLFQYDLIFFFFFGFLWCFIVTKHTSTWHLQHKINFSYTHRFWRRILENLVRFYTISVFVNVILSIKKKTYYIQCCLIMKCVGFDEFIFIIFNLTQKQLNIFKHKMVQRVVKKH